MMLGKTPSAQTPKPRYILLLLLQTGVASISFMQFLCQHLFFDNGMHIYSLEQPFSSHPWLYMGYVTKSLAIIDKQEYTHIGNMLLS